MSLGEDVAAIALWPILAPTLGVVSAAVRVHHAAFGWRAAELAQALRRDQKFKDGRVDLSGSRFSVEEVKQIAEALKVNSSCWTMIFDDAGLTDEHMEALAEGLLHNEALKGLSLVGNPFGDVGARALAQALLRNPRSKLRRLRVVHTKVGDEGLRHLGRAARQSNLRQVQTLVYGWNSSRAGRRQLEEVLAQPRAQRLEGSNYKKCYARATACGNVEGLYKCVQNFLEAFKEARGVKNAEHLKPDEFLYLLKEDVAAVLWTSHKDSADIQLYRAVNAAIGSDMEESVMEHVATFCRTLSLQLVNRQDDAYKELPWPESMRLYRGTWMPRNEVEFLETGTEFRVQQLFATSQKAETADGFIQCFDDKECQKEKMRRGELPVKITVWIPKALCTHVACLESITASRGEAEWLFVAYSAFKVISNENPQKEATCSDPIEITLEAFPDNNDVRDDLPIALRC
eukprot:Skav231216  [mRNA]  locus=scaffold2958:232577:238001:- [translate_table: standard]